MADVEGYEDKIPEANTQLQDYEAQLRGREEQWTEGKRQAQFLGAVIHTGT